MGRPVALCLILLFPSPRPRSGGCLNCECHHLTVFHYLIALLAVRPVQAKRSELSNHDASFHMRELFRKFGQFEQVRRELISITEALGQGDLFGSYMFRVTQTGMWEDGWVGAVVFKGTLGVQVHMKRSQALLPLELRALLL